jgi:hypothetical protein
MSSTPQLLTGFFGITLLLRAIVAAILYLAAPFVLYGIFSRLGRLIEIEENAAAELAQIRNMLDRQDTSHDARTPTAQQRAAGIAAAARWK